MNMHACKLLTHSKIFPPPLIPTLAKPHNGVSHFTNFSKLKFIDAFGRKEYMLTFMMFRAILVVIQGWLSKGLRDVIYFSELKFDHRFILAFGR